jgi:hypothetical protein
MRTVEQLMAEADAYIAKAKAKKGWLKQHPFIQKALNVVDDGKKQYPDSIALEIYSFELTIWYYPMQFEYNLKYVWCRADSYVDSETGLVKNVDEAYIQSKVVRFAANMVDFRSRLAGAQAQLLKEVSK